MRNTLILLVLVAACGGPERTEHESPSGETAGAEVVAPTPPPLGPPQSYVAETDTSVLRMDVERVRASSASNDIGSLVRSYPTWNRLLGGSGIDPIRDFDRVLISAPESINGASTMLIRHHLEDSAIRDAVLRMSAESATPPAWRREGEFDVVQWPAPTDPPRVVVLTGVGELVVTTEAELPRVLEVAANHAAHRERAGNADGLIETALNELEEGLIVDVHAEGLGAYARRMPHPPQAMDLRIQEAAGSMPGFVIAADGRYPDAAAAAAAQAAYGRQRDAYAGQLVVRAVGLDRPLRAATFETEGEILHIRAGLSDEELQRVLGLVALGQLAME